MSDAQKKFDYINSLKAMVFMDDPAVREAFIILNRNLHSTSPADAEIFYERERVHLKKALFNSIDPTKPNRDLRKCTTFSLYSCFMDMAANGDILSFNPDDKLAYIERRGYKCGHNNETGKDVYEERAALKVTPYGELALRIQAGQIRHADNAIVVYDGDLFEIFTDDKMNTLVKWQSKIPRASKKIIGSFQKLTRADGSILVFYMLEEEIERLAAYSARNNRGAANALYGTGENGKGIDAGFLKAKTLKHSFSTFPKCRVKGTNIQLDEVSDTEESDEDQGDGLDYLRRPDPVAKVTPPAGGPTHASEAAPQVNLHVTEEDEGPAYPVLSNDGSTGVTVQVPDEDDW